jgi:hypothetical protein
LLERCCKWASSAAIRAACCWMTASSWTINWSIMSGVYSQLAASCGSPTGSGREVATASPLVTQPEALHAAKCHLNDQRPFTSANAASARVSQKTMPIVR